MTTPTSGAGGRTSAILVALSESPTVSAEEISQRTGIPVSACYRHLTELVRAGLAGQAPTRGRFCAGSVTVQLAENYRRAMLAGGAVLQRLARLASDTEELAAFLIASGDRVLCVEAVEGTRRIRCSYEPGLSQPLTVGASAHAIVAHLATERVEEIWDVHGLDDRERESLRAELSLVRDRGYALSLGAVDDGVWGVSVPVFNAAGELGGVVSTMAPHFRVRRSHDSLVTLTHAAAHDIGRLKEKQP